MNRDEAKSIAILMGTLVTIGAIPGFFWWDAGQPHGFLRGFLAIYAILVGGLLLTSLLMLILPALAKEEKP
jgi:threonine/homoserine/homoserine lactone efflux protein